MGSSPISSTVCSMFHGSICVYIYIYRSVTCSCVRVCVHICTHERVCAPGCRHVYIYIYIYIYTGGVKLGAIVEIATM